MAEDPKYAPLPYLYKSIGLHAREAYDRCPEYSYIFLMNGLERDEESLSSRFGYLIVNRDPDGTPSGQNYFFNFPITSIAKMYFQGNPQRYVGLADGSLWQRNSNSQGQFSEIYTGLSGNPFDTLIASCYATALPFLFIYDQDGSIKIAAGSSVVNLTGIDPPPYTANSVPYAPLLTLIDAFTASNAYITSDVTDWGYAPIETLLATSGQQVTDFTEFFGIYQGGGSSYTPTDQGAEVTATASGGMDTETSTAVEGFPSVPITVGEVVTISVLLQGSEMISAGAEGGGQGTLNFQYSVDSGVTWYTFYTWYGPSLPSGESATLAPTTQSIIINAPGALGNLSTVQLRVVAIANADGDPSPTCTTFGQILSTSAVVTAPGIFGIVAPGMLAVFDSASSSSIPIASIESTDFVSEVYLGLLITTSVPHGFDPSASNYISVYGSSNDLVDGYYPVQQITGSNAFVVPYDVAPGGSPVIGSPLFINATGGFVHGGAATPPCCVLQNQFSTPYPSQMSAWGFYQQVPIDTTAFPISSWSGTVASNATGVIGAYAGLDLSINKQVTDSDLIVLVLAVGSPANIANIRLQFDVDGSGYTSAYYYANIAPSYYQGNIANIQDAYQTTQNQILADALGLLTGQPESSTTAQLQPSNISTGAGSWVAVLIPRGNFLPVGNAGQAGLDWSNITGWQIVVETTATPITGDGSSSIACNGLYLQWGYGPSSFAGVGYDWRYTYYNLATGTESTPSGEQEYNQQYGYLSSLSAPFYLRQAAQIGGYYSSDPQVTHYRVYRRGGIYANNWLLIDQVPNITAGGQFLYKDVVPDASLAQAQPLVLDNDPPVTSSLVTPILTSLAAATTGPGSSFYSTYMPQLITVVDDTAVFVPTQVVLLGNAYNLEEVLVVEGGTGQFTAIVRLQHNAGEQVQVNSTPRTFCNLCCTVNLPGGATQVLVAGDKTNPHRVYYAKPGQPENFGPENYVDSSSPDDPVMALINWRGTGLVATQNTWYIFVGGAQPYLQPTGAAHGMIAQQGWCLVEGEVAFRCLPEDESEILTRTGWKTREQLILGEDVLAYDIESQSCKWTPVEAINVYDFDGELIRVRGGRFGSRFDFSCTPDHTWVWKPGKRCKPYSAGAHPGKWPNKYNLCACGRPKAKPSKACRACGSGLKDKLRPTKGLPVCGNVVQAAPLEAKASLLTPREAAILGWIVTDGSISRNGGKAHRGRTARISQSEVGKFADEIRTLLGSDIQSVYRQVNTTGYSAKRGKKSIVLHFRMSTKFTESLLRKAGFESRHDLPRIVCSLNLEAAEAMFDAMIMADGSRGEHSLGFTQTRNPVMDAFRILAFMRGCPTNAPNYHTDEDHKKEIACVSVTRNPNIDCQGLKKTLRQYSGKVWCPTTKFGTWVARSNDTIAITGNSADGWRFFSGADGKYMTLPVEWIFRTNPDCLPPQASASDASLDVFAYYNNLVIGSYVSLDDGIRYRLIYDILYQRYRQDDIAATAMMWERDTNLLLCGAPVMEGPDTIGYALVEDQQYNQDYDDGGWNTASDSLVQVPVNLSIQLPYKDVGKPHFPKQFNVLETDANTQGQNLETTLFFNTEPVTSIVLPAVNSGTVREKLQQKINNGDGQQAYAMSIKHTMAVTVAPTLFQENIYAAILADYRTSFDSYWQKFEGDYLGIFPKNIYCDYTSTAQLVVSIYADGNNDFPYYVDDFTLIPQANRSTVRVQLPARKGRLWRVIITSTEPCQLWSPIRTDTKPLCEGSGYEQKGFGVYE